ncbi:MAG TPA: DUF1003 domain-containing protein [Marmoricola sp.]|jgi:uncharacterized membrane protein|nr:DUF1003 domain-containing protein [Marmoricola sp.]
MTPEPRKPERRSMEKRLAEKKAGDKKAEERARTRLDQPQEIRRSLVGRSLVGRPAADSDRFGSFAEQFARFMGTARFLIYMTLFVVLWIGWNALAPKGAHFDGYPFIFLTLMLSLQASYAAPLILLAQNRQEVRDRVMTEQDRQANARGHADMEFLAREVASLRMAMGEVATRDFLRSELRGLLAELGERDLEPTDAAQPEDSEQGEQDHRPGAPSAGEPA